MTPPGPIMIGRRQEHDVVLCDPVSRDHAMLVCDRSSGEQAQWLLQDTNSKHGTRLNGVRIQSQRMYPIEAGDLIEMHPFTLQVVDLAVRDTDATMVNTLDDVQSSGGQISAVAQPREGTVQRQLKLLLDCAQAAHKASDDRALAEVVLETAVVGTGFANAAFLSPMQSDGSISVLAHRGVVDGQQPKLSRSLIQQATAGQPVMLSGDMQAAAHGASIVSLGISEALCVPIFLEKTLAGYLYLDSRRESEHARAVTPEDAREFAVGVAQLASMAMANLKRMDVQRRFAALQSDVTAAAHAQHWVLPPREGSFGPVSYVGDSRAGRTISGDFFDIVQLDTNRIAFSVGDVSGKGIEASVLMTATQGYLHAALLEETDLAKVVGGLNTYLASRCSEFHFVTLWTAILDTANKMLHYVDAGHGHAALVRGDGTHAALTDGGGPPVGISSNTIYTAAATDFQPGQRVVVVSDGFVEQVSHKQPASAKREQFEMEGVLRVLHNTANGQNEVKALFEALRAYAANKPFGDDATAMVVRFDDA